MSFLFPRLRGKPMSFLFPRLRGKIEMGVPRAFSNTNTSLRRGEAQIAGAGHVGYTCYS